MSAAEFIPERPTLKKLREAAAKCRGCPLWQGPIQTVFGEGPAKAELMLVGEVPGDREDKRGARSSGLRGASSTRRSRRSGSSAARST